MKYPTYSEFVSALTKPGDAIRSELTAEDCHRLHMAIGVSGEAGELLDAIKKTCIYRKPLDIANVREECGDILFYVTGLLDSLNISMDEVIRENMEKLSLRYQSMAFSNHAAIARADKKPQAQDKDHGSEVKAPAPEDDFEDVKIQRACNLDDEACESCQ